MWNVTTIAHGACISVDGMRITHTTVSNTSDCGKERSMPNPIPKRNASGCPDPTAHEALTGIYNEQTDADDRANMLIRVLKYIVRNSGFEMLARIEIKDSKTGRVYR